MGLGLPHAIGASLADNSSVICLEADGGIMLNIQELATLRQLAPKGFILIILNNEGYQSIRSSQIRFFKEKYGADYVSNLYVPSFQDLANTFKIDYLKIDTHNKFKEFFLNHPKNSPPIIIDLKIIKDEPRGPSVKTIINKNGKPSSTNLSEISW